MTFTRWAAALLLAAFWSPLFSQLTVAADRATAAYAAGEVASFLIQSSASGPATWEIRYDDSTPAIASGATNLTAGQGQALPFSLAQAGAVICVVSQNGQKATGAAAFSPLQAQPSDAEPADFDAFWAGQKAALAAVPMAPAVTFYSQTSRSKTYRVNLGNIQNRRVYGYLSVPNGAGPFPAVVHFTAFGQNAFLTQPLDYLCDELGALTFAVSIHNTEPDVTDPLAYLPNDPTDREKFYYKQAITGGLQVIEYLFSRADFDQSNVALFGESQGGGLALCVAGLDSRVDLVAVSTPALCDHGAFLKGKAAGFPQYVKWISVGSFNDPVKVAAVSAASKYYDGAFFARRAACPALFVGGYLDDLNPAAAVFTAASQLRKPLTFIHGARLGHAHPSEYWLGRNDLTRRFLSPTRTPMNNPLPPQGWGWAADAGADLAVAAPTDTAFLAAKVFQNQTEITSLTARWEVVSAPVGANVWFEKASNRQSKALFTAAGSYVLRFTAEDPSGAAATGNWLSYSDCITVTVGNAPPPPPPPPPPPATVYCGSRSEEPWQQWIARTQLATIDQASQKDGFADRTAVKSTVEKGKSYAVRLTPGFSWLTFDEFYSVWVDWNQDFDFEDAGERVFQNHGLAAVAGSVAVPAGAKNGTTRVRVAMKNGAFSAPCETFQFGEVEDYAFEVVDSIAVPPPPPPPPATYCASKGTTQTNEWISRVRFAALDVSSQKDGYIDRSATSKTTVEQTKNYTIRLTPTFSSGVSRQYWRVWADWNQDLDFEDAGELIFQNNGLGELSASLAIPATAKIGATRLRVSMKRGAYAQPCETYIYGEVEDFGLDVAALIVPPPPPPAANFCAIKSDFPWHEWLAKVEIGPVFSNSSSKEGYADFTAQKIDVALGQTVALKTLVQFSYITHKEHVRAWADWNQNKIFEASEVVFDQRLAAPGAGTNVTAQLASGFAVPATALLGETRLRVAILRADAGETADACALLAFGEAEDYALRVAASLAAGTNRAAAEPTGDAGFLVFPNPTAGQASVVLDEKFLKKPLALQLFSPQGIVVWQQNLAETTEKELHFDWKSLPSATYLLRLESAGIRPTMQKVVLQKL